VQTVRITAVLVAIVASAALSACKAKPSPGPQPRAAAASGPDRLAEGEAPPGVEKAHDLLLPRGAVIERRFGTSIYAVVPLSGEEMANSIRRQATDPEALIGPEGTVFPKVFVKGATPGHYLRVEISGPRFGRARVLVDRIEELPPPQKLPNGEAMKKVGLTPDGKILDPTHFE
jgi:hypothetical protein